MMTFVGNALVVARALMQVSRTFECDPVAQIMLDKTREHIDQCIRFLAELSGPTSPEVVAILDREASQETMNEPYVEVDEEQDVTTSPNEEAAAEVLTGLRRFSTSIDRNSTIVPSISSEKEKMIMEGSETDFDRQKADATQEYSHCQFLSCDHTSKLPTSLSVPLCSPGTPVLVNSISQPSTLPSIFSPKHWPLN